jgi:ATP-dependent exoDNAse (exonuclease V) alpha subunit
MELNEKWDWVETSSPIFEKALDMILNTNENLFIMGPGGVGKSIMLRMAYDHLDNVLVMGSTGISASNLVQDDIPATTIHSALTIPPLDIYAGLKVTSKTRAMLLNAKVILIDEVSMVNASLMDYILSIIINAPKTRRPRLILFGDIFQLPPVAPKRYSEEHAYFERMYNGKYFFFNANLYKKMGFKTIHLDQVYRQEDEAFKDALFRIRVGMQTSRDLKLVNTRVLKADNHMEKHPVLLYLASTNAVVNRLNEKYCSDPKFKMKKHYRARIEDEFHLSKYPHLESHISLSVGQQVMCTANNKSGGYQNGTLGVVESMSEDSVQIVTKNNTHVSVGKATWKEYAFSYNENSGRIDHMVIGTFTQIACKPAYAVTFHKSQGLTLDALYVDLTASWVPESGVYLALSRCTTLEGIGLSRNITNRDIVVNDEAVEFMRNNVMDFVTA